MKDVSYDKHSTLLMHLGMSAGILNSKPQSFSLALSARYNYWGK